MRRFRSSREKPELNSHINVTNLVDVALTILIKYILVAPLITHGIRLNLRKAGPSRLEKSQNVIKIKDDKIYLNDRSVKPGALRKRLESMARIDPEIEVHVEADGKTEYQRVVDVLDTVRRAGVTNVALPTRVGGPR